MTGDAPSWALVTLRTLLLKTNLGPFGPQRTGCGRMDEHRSDWILKNEVRCSTELPLAQTVLRHLTASCQHMALMQTSTGRRREPEP